LIQQRASSSNGLATVVNAGNSYQNRALLGLKNLVLVQVNQLFYIMVVFMQENGLVLLL